MVLGFASGRFGEGFGGGWSEVRGRRRASERPVAVGAPFDYLSRAWCKHNFTLNRDQKTRCSAYKSVCTLFGKVSPLRLLSPLRASFWQVVMQCGTRHNLKDEG